MRQRTYFENLDALRFLAAFAVLGDHITRAFYYPDTWAKNFFIIFISLDGSGGQLGVNFFFVLSGFLISYLLIEEFENSGSIDIKVFYLKRVLRIWPLYYLSLFIGFIIYPLIYKSHIEVADWRMYVLFLANFDLIYFARPENGVLGIQWSVAVEEQFYLIWPLLIWFLLKKRNLFSITVLAITFLSFWYKINVGHRYHTLSCAGALMIGALVAYTSYYKHDIISKPTARLSRTTTFVVYVMMFLLIFFKYKINLNFSFYNKLTYILFPVFSAFVIIDQNYSPHSFFKIGKVKVFTLLGRMSYGIYLLHMVAITIVLQISYLFVMSFWIAIVAVIVLTLVLATCSYYFFEKPFLRLKQKL